MDKDIDISYQMYIMSISTTEIPMKNYANEICYTDVHPNEIVRRVSGKTIEIRRMQSEIDPAWKPIFHVGGFSANCSNQHEQQYSYSSDEDAPIVRIRLHKNGVWKDKYGSRYSLSEKPVRFYDYNF